MLIDKNLLFWCESVEKFGFCVKRKRVMITHPKIAGL